MSEKYKSHKLLYNTRWVKENFKEKYLKLIESTSMELAFDKINYTNIEELKELYSKQVKDDTLDYNTNYSFNISSISKIYSATFAYPLPY